MPLSLLLTAMDPGAAAARTLDWSPASGTALLDYINRLDTHGLDPDDYARDQLADAILGQSADALEKAATRSFAMVARDLANGRTPAAERRLSKLPVPALQPEAVPDLIDAALALGNVAGTLDSLAPASPEYRALKEALMALAPGDPKRARIAMTLERWRWLPQDLGGRYLLVNVPEFRAELIDHGRIVSTRKVIVGKASTPTPQLMATVRSVIFNPSWQVPDSIIRESIGALVRTRPAVARQRGYGWSGAGEGLRIWQKPGPGNALGQVKLDMPNAWAIYLHDTPAKALFDRTTRTFSHGCIRTEGIDELAADLLQGTDWSSQSIADAIALGETIRAPLSKPIPVYIVYFTVRADAGGKLRYLGDPYKLDP